MTDEAKFLAGYLRIAYAESAPAKMRFLEAADLIESLSAELEQVKCERDAAVKDVSGYCNTCAFVHDCAKHDLNDSAPFSCWYYGDCEDWQWRGPQEET